MMRVFILYLFLLVFQNLVAQPTVGFSMVIDNLNEPIQVTNSRDNTNRLFVVEKGGRIKVFNKNYVLLDTLLTITGIPTSNEQGLLAMAFHPNFRTNGYFYVLYTASNNNTIVDRYTISSTNSNKANPGSKLNILNIPHTWSNHNGGEMHFGKDGFLYISTGDGGSGGDPQNNSQNSSNLLGKILRINVDVASGSYSIPAGNPFGNEVYCLGLRNPFRWSFDRYNGDIYIGDVGQNAKEELDYLPASNIAGANFGWRCYEADLPYNTTGCGPITNYIAPVYSYSLSSTERSIMGGVVYRGYKYPDLKNWYFCIDYYASRLRRFNRNTNSWTPSLQLNTMSNLVDFGESEDGEVFVVNIGEGRVYQMTHTNSKTVYTFTGSGDWMTASNWKDGVVPPNPLPSGSVIVIKPYHNGVCNLNTNRTISSGADIFFEPGTRFNLTAQLIVD